MASIDARGLRLLFLSLLDLLNGTVAPILQLLCLLLKRVISRTMAERRSSSTARRAWISPKLVSLRFDIAGE
jgi:uncharacterized membrane protein